MVVRCFSCNTLLKVDEKKIGSGPETRIRCPKCEAEGLLDPNSAQQESETVSSPLKGQNSETDSGDSPKNRERHAADSSNPLPGNENEITIPEDAFRDFRFPAEDEPSSYQKPNQRFGPRLIAFVIASILTVVIFAALVNVILPGLPPVMVDHISHSLDQTRQ